MICREVYPGVQLAIPTRQEAIHTLTGSPPGAEAILPPFLHLHDFPLSYSGPLLLPNLCTKSLCLFLVTLEPILSPPVPLHVKEAQIHLGIQDLTILCYKLQTSSSVISCWIGVPSALFFMFTIARGCFLKCVFIVFATPVMTLFLPKTLIRCLAKQLKVNADNNTDKTKKVKNLWKVLAVSSF